MNIDVVNFEAIDKVAGAGTINQQMNYSFLDSKPLAGTTYYRLKQVDLTTFPVGTYLLKIIGTNFKIVKRIVKQ